MGFIFRRKLTHGHTLYYVFGIKVASTRNPQSIIGKNNIVKIPPKSGVRLSVYGDNNEIIIDENTTLNMNMFIGLPELTCNNCKIHIGAETTVGGAMIRICEDNTKLIIGRDCQFSTDIQVWASDTHTITDATGKIRNIGREIIIGDHVWVGHGASICKNTIIADGCVVGTKAVLSGKYEKPNSTIVGNPAQCVRVGETFWDRRRPKQYISG